MKRPGAPAAAELERIRAIAKAAILQRQRQGLWSAGAEPHWSYQDRPLEWICKYLEIPEETLRWTLSEEYGDHEWDGDKDPMIQILDALVAWNDCGVESATGTGKTFLAACITLWFLACFKDSLVVTGAPKEDQLLLHVWMEIGKMFPRFQRHFPDAELLSGKLRMKPDEDGKETWAAIAFVAGVGADEETATRARGFHREHMLIITEETPGIHTSIMSSFSETRTDDHNLHLALGNPEHRADPLHRFCFNLKEEPQPGVVNVRISALDHPNIVTSRRIVPGAIGRTRLKRRIEKLGEGTRKYNINVRGLCPAQAEDALISWEWCVRAAKRWEDEDLRDGPLALGVDVADAPEGDPAAIARWQGACLTQVESFQVEDAAEVGERIVGEIQDEESPINPYYVGVDAVGVGASAVNQAKRMGVKVRALQSGAAAVPLVDVDARYSETAEDEEGNVKPAGPRVVQEERFYNIRSQMWWLMADDLRLNKIALPWDESLFQDLCTPTQKTRGGKILVEAKEDIIARLKRSPNKGDAAVYGNFVRNRRPTKKKLQKQQKGDYVGRGPNRDIGLEKQVARQIRIKQAREKQIKRMLRRTYRKRNIGT